MSAEVKPWWICPYCSFDAKAFEPRPEKVRGAARWHAAVCKQRPGGIGGS